MKRTLLKSALLLFFLFFTLSAFSQTTGSFTDSRDGQTYKTVKIGDQVWMAENLNYMTSSGSWAYNSNDSIAEIYGRLYIWETACKVCPEGWHLPSDEEWTALINYLGGDTTAGAKLKEKGTVYWKSPNEGTTNESRFSALPGGLRGLSGGFGYIGIIGGWFSSSEDSSNSNLAGGRIMGYGSSRVGSGMGSDQKGFGKLNGMSVRCIKD